MKQLRFKEGDLALVIKCASAPEIVGSTCEILRVGPFPSGMKVYLPCGGRTQALIINVDYIATIPLRGYYGAFEDAQLMPLKGDGDEFRREQEQEQELASRFVIRGIAPRARA